jgi:aminoglycoside/choline kinase family phosphotransferase
MATIFETELSERVIEMAARQLNAPASALSIARLTGDASTRSYFRVLSGGASLIVARYAEAFDERERASDRLARLEATNPPARLTFANDPCAHIEVTALLEGAGLPVPRVLAASGSDGALLMEDVGDVRLQDWLIDNAPESRSDAYREAIRHIVKIQEATRAAIDADSICSRLAFDEAKLRWELGFFFANYVNHYLGLKLDADTSKGIQGEFKALCSELAARPRVLTHRDYHARNLMMREGDLYIIDHQDARMGPASYDLASLISDPYTALDRAASNELIDYFIDLKSASAAPLEDAGEFRTELELMTVQRMLKAIGTYSYQAAVLNNPAYVAYIEPAVKAALEAARSLGRFDQIRALFG